MAVAQNSVTFSMDWKRRPRDFKTFDEFYEAYKKQHLYFLDHVLIQQTTLDIVKPKFLAAPLTSMLHDKCFEQCKDINDYVDPGEDGLREKFCDMTGFGTGVDSLAAIKKLVYDEKRITMDELITALDANFEGYEAIRQMCLNAPNTEITIHMPMKLGKTWMLCIWVIWQNRNHTWKEKSFPCVWFQ